MTVAVGKNRYTKQRTTFDYHFLSSTFNYLIKRRSRDQLTSEAKQQRQDQLEAPLNTSNTDPVAWFKCSTYHFRASTEDRRGIARNNSEQIWHQSMNLASFNRFSIHGASKILCTIMKGNRKSLFHRHIPSSSTKHEKRTSREGFSPSIEGMQLYQKCS